MIIIFWQNDRFQISSSNFIIIIIEYIYIQISLYLGRFSCLSHEFGLRFVPRSSTPDLHISLYLPTTMLQRGQKCFTVCRLSTKKGRQKQGQSPVMQSTAERDTASRPGLEAVLVVMEAWQPGHWMLAGLGPSSGTVTLTTLTTVRVSGNMGPPLLAMVSS